MKARILLLSALFLACGPASGDSDTPLSEVCQKPSGPIRHPDRLTYWVEFLTPDEVVQQMEFGSTHQLNFNVAFPQQERSRDDLERICDAAARSDVALRLWPLLPEAQGYWPNQGNVDTYLEYVDELLGWAEAVCPGLDGIVVDMEMPIQRMETLLELMDTGDISALVDFVSGGIDEVAFERARELYREAVEAIQARGLTVGVTSMPWVVDDLEDGDEGLAVALWTPVEGIGWDRVSFMVYRSVYDRQYASFLGDPDSRFTSGLVTSYSRSIVQWYGDRSGIDLGTTGVIGMGIHEGLADAGELHSDMGTALAEGIPVGGIAVYSLEGLFEHPDPEAWVVIPPMKSIPEDPMTVDVRQLFRLLDGLDLQEAP